ncbi:NADH-quinone oxidoreductase [Phlegmacium glaucopus]|nr:NADH-quinone oxidoreductase [Phlegmacium glaucopus]
MSSPRIAIIIYTMYGHIAKMAESVKKGIIAGGGNADIFQVPETLSAEILTKMKAPPKPDYPIANNNTLINHDAFLIGIPTRYGNMPAQMKAFWDATGHLWLDSQLKAKYAGVFVSTSGPGGGQESTAINFLSTLAHHGIIYVPIGYETIFRKLISESFDEVNGGSPWGAGTFSGLTGLRTPTKSELKIAEMQGKTFYEVLSRVKWIDRSKN